MKEEQKLYKAYYLEPERSEFECRIEEKISINDKTYYLFDIFPFYPGGGGEEADCGYCMDKKLEECIETGEKVYYSFDGNIGEVGDTVRCWADIPLRRERSIMHTSQHILSAIFADMFSLVTESVHFSDTYAAIDLSSDDITDENIRYTENKANEIVRSCIDVSWKVVEKSDLKNYRLRKVLGDVESPRVVSIPSVDDSLCCAVHVKNTGHIGIIKILRIERKASKMKVFFTAGQSALEDYSKKNDIVSKINTHLSSTVDNVIDRLLKKDDDIASLRKKLSAVREELMVYELEKFVQSDIRVITKEGSIDEMKVLAATLMERSEKVFVGIDRSERKLIIYQNINRPVNAAIGAVKENFDAKGGGNASSGQVMVNSDMDEVVNFLISYFDPMDGME